MKLFSAVFLFCILSASALAQQQPPSPPVQQLEQKLDSALEQLAQLTATIESLRSDLARLKKGDAGSSAAPATSAKGEPFAPSEDQASTANAEAAAYRSRILGTSLSTSERDESLTARPELFFQGRYSAAPIAGSDDTTPSTVGSR